MLFTYYQYLFFNLNNLLVFFMMTILTHSIHLGAGKAMVKIGGKKSKSGVSDDDVTELGILIKALNKLAIGLEKVPTSPHSHSHSHFQTEPMA